MVSDKKLIEGGHTESISVYSYVIGFLMLMISVTVIVLKVKEQNLFKKEVEERNKIVPYVTDKLLQSLAEYKLHQYDTISKELKLDAVQDGVLGPLVDRAKHLLTQNTDLALIPQIILFAMHLMDLEAKDEWYDGGVLLISALHKLQSTIITTMSTSEVILVEMAIVSVLQPVKFGSNGETLLHAMASEPGLSQLIGFFITVGWEDINCVDDWGRTPLTCAMKGVISEIDCMANVRALLEGGADLYAGTYWEQPVGLVIERPLFWRDVVLRHITKHSLQKHGESVSEDMRGYIESAHEHKVALEDIDTMIQEMGYAPLDYQDFSSC